MVRHCYNSAIGCPACSAAPIIPCDLPTIAAEPSGGFRLTIIFRSPNWPRPCNYQYTFTAIFAPDGTLTVQAGNEGRGCGTDGVYHPILRVAPPPAGGAILVTNGVPTPLTTEGNATWPAGGNRSLVIGEVQIAPDWGDAGEAYIYWSVTKPEEGQGDLPSIGECWRLDIQQGPGGVRNPTRAAVRHDRGLVCADDHQCRAGALLGRYDA